MYLPEVLEYLHQIFLCYWLSRFAIHLNLQAKLLRLYISIILLFFLDLGIEMAFPA